jgi:hypothetical protein
MPRPSYSFLDASSRGERGVSLDEEDLGVVGEELDAMELEEEPSSLLSEDVSIETAGMCWAAAGLNRRGCGRNLPGIGTDCCSGGGVTLTMGEDTVRLFPRRTELLFPPRLQELTESDLEGKVPVPLLVILLEPRPPSEVPPLMIVVEWGVGGREELSLSSDDGKFCKGPVAFKLTVRLPNLPPSAAVIGSGSVT